MPPPPSSTPKITTTLEPPPPRPSPRRRFIEFHEQPYTPAFIRQPIQDMLTLAWTNRFPGLQRRAPAEMVVGVLERVLAEPREAFKKGGAGKGKERGDRGGGDDLEGMTVVDFCSGAGGPIQTIERIMNPTGSLYYVEEGVDATDSPRDLVELGVGGGGRGRGEGGKRAEDSGGAISTNTSTSTSTTRRRTGNTSNTTTTNKNKNDNEDTPSYRHSDRRSKRQRQRHFRTFFLAFHHFDEDMAVRVLKDAMEGGDGIGIFELQKFDLGSLLTITGLWPLTWIYTPWLRPSLLTLIFTYLIPIVPFILVLDGYVSAYRSREFEHIRYLAKIAHDQLVLDGKTPRGGKPWVWEEGSETHTWPGGKAYWVVGKRAD
ncbi:hypothetical protein HD553DRAFT_351293 [Filobasidium floriforme]|uniref:uncharacterized protein n=1 Tax=Filobasidium floriforme TaxID=5210 RepID=UPI001E8EC08B|nr:uncharacterized protein HD553DRAFT_351293 [Filobasidium floriforme]KAH8082398.1 hypothetical protein HD553DRAFT_351293 [Filobasidium floriforme]